LIERLLTAVYVTPLIISLSPLLASGHLHVLFSKYMFPELTKEISLFGTLLEVVILASSPLLQEITVNDNNKKYFFIGRK
jgi:hypothetical protein